MVLLTGCDRPVVNGPQAPRHAYETTRHGDLLVDHWHYLNDLDHPDTVRYLSEEMKYTETAAGAWSSLRAEIERKINALLPDTTASVPVMLDGYEYTRELLPGSQYPRFVRRHGETGQTEIVLDLNRLAGESPYFRLGDFAVSPDASTVAFTEDRQGDQSYRLRLIDISTGDLLPAAVDPVAASVTWAPDGSLLYIDAAGRSVISLDPRGGSKDTVYTESDRSFDLALRQTRDRKFVVISARNHDTTDSHLLDIEGGLTTVVSRKAGHRYHLRQHEGRLYALTNWRRPNFGLAEVTPGARTPDDWRYLELPPVPAVTDFELFDNHIVLATGSGISSSIVAMNRESHSWQTLAVSKPGSIVRLGSNPDPAARKVSVFMESLLHPQRTASINLDSGESLLINGEHPEAEGYRVESLTFDSRDGFSIPLTLLYREGARKSQGGAPGYVTAYAAYGISMPVRYEPGYRVLMDRGFVIARIHARGGGELGTAWHNAGRQEHKYRSVDDVIDGVRFLISNGYLSADRVFARGRSAGATIMAAAMNREPALFRAVVGHVPFVDLLNTLSDTTHHLTPSDHMEWGDPRDRQDYFFLKALSPYDQVRPQAYPDVLITTAMNDRRVYPAEALRWLARLRANNTGDAQMLIDISRDAGHLGASDQYNRRRLESLEYAFILSRL